VITFGEHKGYALAFVCEMLAGALCGSGTMRPERQGAGTATNGMLTIVIDPSRLIDREWLRAEIAAMTQYITASPPQHPDEPVLIPGDPERLTRAERIANGVPIDDETWRELTTAARGIDVLQWDVNLAFRWRVPVNLRCLRSGRSAGPPLRDGVRGRSARPVSARRRSVQNHRMAEQQHSLAAIAHMQSLRSRGPYRECPTTQTSRPPAVLGGNSVPRQGFRTANSRDFDTPREEQ
jgi:hypothetical protein